MDAQRRRVLKVLGTGAWISASALGAQENDEAEVTPGEDLMQEHGVLERLLLVYDEVARRIETGEPVDLDTSASAARIVQRFVENYHERNEERFVFSAMERRGTLVGLVRLLRLQHERGRIVTAEILRLSTHRAGGIALVQQLRAFERMYRPHAAREDTVLFPAFRATMGKQAYSRLGDRLEDTEHQTLGDRGFERTVEEVAQIEAALRIGDLAQFTPS